MLFGKKRKRKYQMNQQAAGALLQNILASSGRPESSVSLDEVLEEINREEKTLLPIHILVTILLLVTFMLPLFFEHPPIRMKQQVKTADFNLGSDYELNGNIYLTFYGQKVNAKASSMRMENGMQFSVTSYDEKTNTISFPYYKVFGPANIMVVSEDGTFITIVMEPNEDE